MTDHFFIDGAQLVSASYEWREHADTLDGAAQRTADATTSGFPAADVVTAADTFKQRWVTMVGSLRDTSRAFESTYRDVDGLRPVSTGKLAAMGLVALLLTACGIGGSDGPQAPKVAAGELGLEQVQDEAVDLLRKLAPEITRETDLTVDSATGTYQSSGNAGTFFYDYVATAELVGERPAEKIVAKVFDDAGLKVSTYETPEGNPAVQGRRGGITAVLFIDPDASIARLQVTRGGAEIKSDPVTFPAQRRAELRKESPVDLAP